MVILVSWRFVINDSLCVLTCWTSCVCRISLSLSHTRSSVSCHVSASTVTALLKVSDTRTFERNPVVSALVAELTTIAMSNRTDRLAVWDEDPDSFDDFAAQCRWRRDGLKNPEQGLATTRVVRLFTARSGKTWNLIQRLDNKYLREWFGLECLHWRIREEIRHPTIPEMTKYLDTYFFRLKKNKQESMSAWALRAEKVNLHNTRALARLEQRADSTEPDWNLLYERQQNWSRWNNWSGV